MAPLAATVAATMAVGVGVAVARAGRGMLLERGRRRSLGLHAGEPLGDGLRRMALEQIDLALELLQGADGRIEENAVHETRKALKRLRALVRLLREELGEQAYARESDALRRVAVRLSGARDTEVLLATLDGLIERHPRKLRRRRPVSTLREHLAAERARMQRVALADPLVRAEAVGELLGVRARVSGWPLPAADGLGTLEPGLARIYGRGRRRYRRAAAGKGSRTTAMHMWRKRVKDLRYAAEMLERDAQHGPAARAASVVAGRRGRALGRSEELRRIARRADELGELLGEEHDLAVLALLVRGSSPAGVASPPQLPRRSRALLLKLVKRRRRRLRTRALRLGARLYGRKPRRFVRRVRSAYKAAR